MRRATRFVGWALIGLALAGLVWAAEITGIIRINWPNHMVSAEPIGFTGSASMPPIPGAPPYGTVLATVTIPRLGTDVVDTPVIQGITDDILAKGLGHFPETALPGQVGNFALAGHRTTHGAEMDNIDRLRVGDFVYVKTADNWYIYRLFRDRIVTPEDYWVVDAAPFGEVPGMSTHLITLTTCHPRWQTSERWIWWGELVNTLPTTGEPPPLDING